MDELKPIFEGLTQQPIAFLGGFVSRSSEVEFIRRSREKLVVERGRNSISNFFSFGSQQWKYRAAINYH